MKLHYQGKYNLDPSSLPHGVHMPNAVKFDEPDDSKELGRIAVVIGLIVMAVLAFPVLYYCGGFSDVLDVKGCLFILVGNLLSMFPHEFLHAICFKEDVYMYTNLKEGMMFVVGPETMSKNRFIFMSLLPNLVLGLFPIVVGIIFPELKLLTLFGLLEISCGGGDYYNVYHAFKQMPKGARTYLYQFHSYWYLPSETEKSDDWVEKLLSLKETQKIKV